MPIAESVFSNRGVASARKTSQCPICKADAIIQRIIYYVDLDACPEYHSAVVRQYASLAGAPNLVVVTGERAVEEDVTCQSCGRSFGVTTPIVVDIPSRDIMVFVTHMGDDGGVEAGFRTWLRYCAKLLPKDVMQAVATRPYTFVHGWSGLEAMLAMLAGNAYHPAPPPYKHATADELRFEGLKGYLYGTAFFFYPRFNAVSEIASTLLDFSTGAEHDVARRDLAALLQLVLETLREDHPWLSQELGRLYLDLNQKDEAMHWLKRALVAQHQWLAVTTSFMDATPGTNDEQDEGGSSFPGGAMAVNGPVTGTRHAVTRIYPANRDFGLWCFPEMERHAPTIRPERFLTVASAVLGTLDRMVWDDNIGWDRMAVLSLAALGGDVVEWLEHWSLDPSLANAVERFWSDYIKFRWHGRAGRGELEEAERLLLILDDQIAVARKRLPEGALVDSRLRLFRFGYDPVVLLHFLAKSRESLLKRLSDA